METDTTTWTPARVPLRTATSAMDEGRAVACKVCGGPAPLFDVVDFHKSCEQHRGIRFVLSGIGVWYRRCTSCGFLFTNFCDAWTAPEFAERIYNADYVLVDPDYVTKRPLGSVKLIRQLFEPAKAAIKLLDYGGGDGEVAQALRAAGFDSACWDPFGTAGQTPPLARGYDLVTCFEVIEHTPDPLGTVEAIANLLRPGGIVFFSTLLQPADLPVGNLDWWYVGPRNGHISIHTDESLARRWRKVGMRVASFGTGTHVAFGDTLPDFARILYRVAGARGLP
jgi:SAM-dependent methyltransferase